MYVNAAWDPRWEDSYVAPRVTFEASFPRAIRDVAHAIWNERNGTDGGDTAPKQRFLRGLIGNVNY